MCVCGIDESGRDDQPGRVDRARAPVTRAPRGVTDEDDAVAAQRDVGAVARRAGAVVQRAAGDQDVGGSRLRAAADCAKTSSRTKASAIRFMGR